MRYIISAIAVGVITYLALVVHQPRDRRLDIETWQDRFSVAAVASLVLVGFIAWSAFAQLPDSTWRAVLEAPVHHRTRGLVMYLAGFAVASFAVLCGLHVATLRLRDFFAPRRDV